jgi:signal transduction histidine kinase
MARILVVDDDPVIIRLYEIILNKAGFTLLIARSGEEMLNLLKAQKPDVILLDVILPDQTGLDLCYRIKSDPEYPGIKIILVSATEISPSQVADGIDIGADDYLVKPFDPKELMARIKYCLKLKRAEEDLRDKNKELKDLSNHLQNVREQERKIIAREVQEEVGQLAAALKMDIDWLSINIPGAEDVHKERITHASNTARLIINTIRRIASSLRPSMIDELGLNASLEWLCSQFSGNNPIACSFIPADDDEGLSIEIRTAIFRICQDSLQNVSQHSAATDVKIIATVNKTGVSLHVEDNGRGFDVPSRKNALGLIGMRERALAINGKLQIESQPGKGTRVSVVVPRK